MPHDDIVMPGYPGYRAGEQTELDLGEPKQLELGLLQCANKGCTREFPPDQGRYVVGMHLYVCSNPQCYQAVFRQLGPSPMVCIGNCRICPHCDG